MVYEPGASERASTPGSRLPSRNSSDAPPAGRDVLDLVCHPGLLDGGDGIAAAHDRDGGSILRQRFRDAGCAAGKGRHLKDAHGPIPDDGAGSGDLCREQLDRSRTDVERHPAGGEGTVALEDLGTRVGGEFVGQHVIDGQQKAHSFLLGFLERFTSHVELVGFHQRLAHVLSLGLEEGISHAAADEQRVDLAQQVVDHLDLVGDLSPAEDRDKRLLRSFQGFAQVIQLLFQQQPGCGLRDKMGDALGRSVRPMSAAKGVVHIDVAKAGELSREVRVVGFFSGVEAQVLEQQNLPRFELARQFGGQVAHAVGREGNVDRFTQRVIEQRAQPVHHRPQAVFGVRFSFGAPQVRGHNHFRVMAQRVLERRQGLFDPGIVENLQTVLGERHVEINADKEILVVQLQVADGEFRHGSSPQEVLREPPLIVRGFAARNLSLSVFANGLDQEAELNAAILPKDGRA